MRNTTIVFLSLAVFPMLFAPSGLAQDGERALLVVDPGSSEALEIGHHYQAAYDIPASHVVYMEPGGAGGYAELVEVQLETMLALIEARGIADQIDFVLLAPSAEHRVAAGGLVSDGCSSVNHFALSSAYGLARQSEAIMAGVPVTKRNEFSATDWGAAAFEGAQPYRVGDPSTSPNAERYFIGATLGWMGAHGNSKSEILDMIDRGAASLGTHPVGTAYFMETTDIARSGPRHGLYPEAVVQMGNAGGLGAHLQAVLPLGQQDAMGIMTGVANLDILGGDFTLLPGSFADHLTSYAGTFSNNSQTKMTLWLAKGASATSGAIEEPCNYSGKFPTARLHTTYRHGSTLGEAWFRHHAYYPFQSLLLGDPLVRPYAQEPTVSLANPPSGAVSGVVNWQANAAATASGANIVQVEWLLDGARIGITAPGQPFAFDSTGFCDGWHELRIRAVDDSPARFVGHWVGEVVVSNQGLDVSLASGQTDGDLSTAFQASYVASGGPVASVVLLQNGRVVSASVGSSGMLAAFGQNLGAGTARVQAEVLFGDGSRARSAPLEWSVDPVGGGAGSLPPTAFGYERTVPVGQPFLIELPASFDTDLAAASYTLVGLPSQASLVGGQGAWRVFEAGLSATGSDVLTFQVTDANGVSGTASITLHYDNPCPAPFVVCSPLANSTGVPARMDSLGSTSVSDNSLVLLTSQCPPGQFGIYFYGQDQTAFPSGDGVVCIQNQYNRLPIAQADPFGSAFLALDLTNPPTSTGQILAGSTWIFQFWYRDTGFGQFGYNFSDALSVTFCP